MSSSRHPLLTNIMKYRQGGAMLLRGAQGRSIRQIVEPKHLKQKLMDKIVEPAMDTLTITTNKASKYIPLRFKL